MDKRDVIWEDSGFDCDHCGGEILKRTDLGQPDQEPYLQCNQCGCRWSPKGDVLRVGSGQFCGGNGRQQDAPTITFDKRYAWVIAAVVIVLLMFYFGGFALFSFAYQLIRFLIPVGIIILIGMGIYWVGREQGFWE